MNELKARARDWIPPAVVRWAGRVGRSTGIRFEGKFDTWDQASAHSSGYDAKEILAKVLTATLKVKRGEAAFERDSVLFDEAEYTWPVLAGLLWAAARNAGTLNVLDFGGALGSGYFQNRKFLGELFDVRWNVVEQAHYVAAGRAQIQDEVLRFYESIEACLKENKPNVILLSSVLQYVETPIDIVGQLSKARASSLLIDRTPFSNSSQDRLLIQRVPANIYVGSYPMWVFSKSAFMKMLGAEWRLVASTLSPEGFVRSANGLDFSFQGMLLEARG